jgi:hypothetical protein
VLSVPSAAADQSTKAPRQVERPQAAVVWTALVDDGFRLASRKEGSSPGPLLPVTDLVITLQRLTI